METIYFILLSFIKYAFIKVSQFNNKGKETRQNTKLFKEKKRGIY